MRSRCGIPSFVDPDFIALLRQYGVAFVVADTSGLWPEKDDVSADFVYVRLHGARRCTRARTPTPSSTAGRRASRPGEPAGRRRMRA